MPTTGSATIFQASCGPWSRSIRDRANDYSVAAISAKGRWATVLHPVRWHPMRFGGSEDGHQRHQGGRDLAHVATNLVDDLHALSSPAKRVIDAHRNRHVGMSVGFSFVRDGEAQNRRLVLHQTAVKDFQCFQRPVRHVDTVLLV